MIKDKIKIFKRFLARVIFKAIAFLVGLMPLGLSYRLADFLASAGFLFLSRHRKTALQSLDLAFGNDISNKEKITITKECFRYIARSAIALSYCLGRRNPVISRYSIQGIENLENAFKKGSGVVAVSAHFGNFPFLLTALAREGFKVNIIMRYLRDSKFENYFNKKREEAGIHTIHSTPRDRCVKESLKALRANELLFVLLDQHFGSGGILVDFFKRKALTATGPAVFAMRTKAAVVPVFIVRNQDNTHKIIIEPEIKFEDGSDSDKIIYDIVSKSTSIIEKYVRLYPSHWGWIHRRWKGQENS